MIWIVGSNGNRDTDGFLESFHLPGFAAVQRLPDPFPRIRGFQAGGIDVIRITGIKRDLVHIADLLDLGGLRGFPALSAVLGNINASITSTAKVNGRQKPVSIAGID